MDDLLEIIIQVLLWPYFWWRGHNQDSRLGTSADEDEAERFWLKFGLYGIGVVAVVALVVHYYHPA